MNLGGFYDKRFEEGKYGKEAVHLSPDPNHYHQKILKIIKSESEDRSLNILDVGCATGYLGAKAKTYNKNNYVCGIEISEIAAEMAKKSLDKVIVGNIEEIELPYPEKYFDIIICSDVIEHLFEPKKFLKKIKAYLRTEGIMLVVMPNVVHYTIRLAVLKGKWNYQSHGILDYGHLRFFTKDTAIKIFKDSGYSVEKTIPYISLPFPINVLDRMLKGAFTQLFTKRTNTLFAFTYLNILRKEEKL